MTPDAILQRRLVTALIVYEVFVISSLAFTGVTIALSGDAPIYAALPVFLFSASEALRVPLAAWATRLSFSHRLMAIVVLACLALASAEGIAMALDTLFDARISLVKSALRAVDAAQADLAQAEQKAAPLRATIENDEREIAALDAKQTALIAAPPQQPGFSGKSCGKRGNRPCTVDSIAQGTYKAALGDHSRQMASIDAERKSIRQEQAQASAALALIDLSAAQSALANASHIAGEAAERSPVHRIAAAVFDTRASDLTPSQLSQFRKYAIGGLSIALASMSALVSWLAFQKPQGEGESRLSRSIRAYVARKRKPLVRIVEKPIPAGIKTRHIYVPVSGADDGLLKKAGLRADAIKAYSELAQ